MNRSDFYKALIKHAHDNGCSFELVTLIVHCRDWDNKPPPPGTNLRELEETWLTPPGPNFEAVTEKFEEIAKHLGIPFKGEWPSPPPPRPVPSATPTAANTVKSRIQ